jgi:hypothetical protein
MTATNQNFSTYAGDAVAPVVTVLDPAGNALDISTATEIVWNLKSAPQVAPALEKRFTLGGIAFVTDGTDGRFQVAVQTGDTANLAGRWKQQAEIFDAAGAQSTVLIGAVRVIAH